MSVYQTSRRRLPAFFLFLLFLLFGIGWYGYSQLSERVVDALRKTTGLSVQTDSVDFNLFSNQLSLRDITLNASGVRLTAKTADITLRYSHWFDVWLSRAPIGIGDISVQDARIQLIPAEVSPLKIKPEQTITFDQGTLVVIGLDEPVPFSEIILFPVTDQGFNVQVRGVGVLPWLFEGQLRSDEPFLVGQLELSEQPLSFLFPESVGIDGSLNANLSVEFSQDRGLEFEGSLEGGEGRYEQNGSAFFWKQWQMEGFRYSSLSTLKPIVELDVTGVELVLSSVDMEQPYRFPVAFLSQFPVQPTVINAPDGVFRTPVSSWLLRNLFLGIQVPSEFIPGEEVLQYRLNADFQSGGQIGVLGSLINEKGERSHRYQVQLNHIVLNELLKGDGNDYTTVDGYNLKDSRLSLTYDSVDRSGELVLEDWRYKADTELHQIPMTYLKKLLTNQEGNASTPFVLRSPVTAELFVGKVHKSVLSEWKKVTAYPFEYLAGLIPDKLSSTLNYRLGESLLTLNALGNMKSIQKLMTIRPQLKLMVSVGVSEQEDWEVLVRNELDQSLDQLYQISNPGKSGPVPQELRGQLVELMYLNTQKQKIPEVGEKSERERQLAAERWLLERWPKNPALLKELQQQRMRQMRKQLRSMGFADELFDVRAAFGGQPSATIQFR